MHSNRTTKLYAVGVDIGGTKILILITDQSGRVLFKKRVESTGDLERICEIINAALKEASIAHHQIMGMTVGIPGHVDSLEGIVKNSVQLGWKDLNIKAYISRRFSFPVFIKNDVNCAALGEKWLGNGENSSHMVYISLGTGVGGAIIANGSLVEGSTYSAGEFGYITDSDDIKKGIDSDWDQYGNLERKISGFALDEKARQIGLTARELFVEYNKGNSAAQEIIDSFIKNLSLVISNLVNILNPEYVIIGGGVSESMECILDPIKSYVKKLTMFPTKIRLSKLGGEGGAFGCVYNVLSGMEDSTEQEEGISKKLEKDKNEKGD
ncbi:ROK family protein [Geosporobacter ferrireducens]|uniref:Sugar kinase n=1 Tax=Geosporobacter ferrireducens TaxID=1424294 RepID=A0A1D8GNZ8_9FIRM|nr:ROK family protein [Geosporobacter ferrireducens]AOT72612.1 hypothetical protein Gferi_25495 [Geosporobacter ferrireducens]MTI55014.1 ROK family protein [Geosporobacter ferrireducens]